MNTQDIKTKEDAYTAPTYARYDVALVRGKGARARDPEGREYIDFTSGIGVNALGFCDPAWVEAVQRQAAALQHTSNLYYTEPCARAAEKLMALTGMENMFFANSGAEANEGAIKCARKYSFEKYGQGEEGGGGRYRIVTLEGSFHGRTIATITATGQENYHRYFTPFLQGFDYAQTNNTASLLETVTDQTCAIMVEFVQGEGGVIELDRAFVSEIERLCAERDILLIADEVQAGVGRTGRFCSYEYYGVKPDIVTLAKGLGGGLPIGGVLFSEKTKDVLRAGDHGSTFGGGPVVCAGMEAVLDRFADGSFLKEITDKGAYMREKLAAMDGVAGVSGLGLMLGADIGGRDASAVVKACLARGLLLLTAKKRLRFLPPLVVTKEDIDEGLAILAGALAEAPEGNQ
ncbi:MAG: acetylornithine/succinylornithine family transaminase [Clostridiales Family XIII bacterium]|jgi:acetylornithine/N-succinyldiaminopimelate aminotransferase|nr:acetylornithine/succinylornithine family transaminase [Clostridiales Family XIII bacterium]